MTLKYNMYILVGYLTAI